MGLRAGLEGQKPRPHRDSIPDRPARSSVAISSELPGPHVVSFTIVKLTWAVYL